MFLTEPRPGRVTLLGVCKAWFYTSGTVGASVDVVVIGADENNDDSGKPVEMSA